jgi:GAF domain-containing protein
LFLDEKLSGNPYSKKNIELLENLSSQIAISLQNSLLFRELVKDKEMFERFREKTLERGLRIEELKQKIKELEEKLKEKE